MARIRIISIETTAAFSSSPGIPGKVSIASSDPATPGKSSILDAIDLCLGARRNTNLADDIITITAKAVMSRTDKEITQSLSVGRLFHNIRCANAIFRCKTDKRSDAEVG